MNTTQKLIIAQRDLIRYQNEFIDSALKHKDYVFKGSEELYYGKILPLINKIARLERKILKEEAA